MAKDKVKKVEVEARKQKVYYCTKGEFSFAIPEYERDEHGEVLRNEKGIPKKLYVTDSEGNNKHLVHIHIKFERIPIKDPKNGKTSAMEFLGRLIVDPSDERYDDIVNHVEQCKKNRYSGILSEDEYKSLHNPDAYAFEKKLGMYETENAELKDYNEKLRQKLASMGVNLDSVE